MGGGVEVAAVREGELRGWGRVGGRDDVDIKLRFTEEKEALNEEMLNHCFSRLLSSVFCRRHRRGHDLGISLLYSAH
jgi:hypothetical protein